MLWQRLLTAIVGIPLFIFLIHKGGNFFTGTICLLAAVALYELNNMATKKDASVYFFTGMLPVIILCLSAYLLNNITILFFLVSIFILMIMLEGIFRNKQPNWFYNNLYSILAICYIGIFFAQVILLRQYKIDLVIATAFGNMSLGESLLWLALLGTWASDTFAYFVGTTFGKNKLCPNISPNKSWEGAIGGFFGCIATVYLVGTYLFFTTEVNLFALGLIVALFAPLGDLAQSQLKRFSGVKDSGNIFPGHGGVLDRFDSLLFVAPAVCAYLYITI